MDPRFRGTPLPQALARLAAERGAEAVPVLCPDPVFLLSAGWRSGSTLLQRLIASDRRTLIWGEPFGDRIPVHRLAQTLEPWADGDAHAAYAIERFEGELSDSWIANLNPGAAALRAAHLAWFETLFAAPARARGYARWGCKWVRLTAFHAHYLRWLYPRARLVFLVRHPFSAWSSYRALGETWYFERPATPIRTAADFLGHWGALAESFASQGSGLRALLVRHEDLVGRSETLTRLARFLDAEIDPGTLRQRVGAAPATGRRPELRARLYYRRHLGAIGRSLGYDARGGVRSLPEARDDD